MIKHGAATRTALPTTASYLSFGPAESWTLGNSLIVDRSFDQDYRLTGVTTTPVIDYSYAYDPAGNIVQWGNLLDTSRSQSFGYDALDRLIEATGVYGELDYGYDPVGNRLDKTKTDGGTSTTDTYAYDPDSNRLTGITGGTTEVMTYDAVGNIITRAGKTYTYNAANRLAAVEENGQPLASYQHNGKGERIIKTANGTTTHFVYDLMGNIIAEADITGAVEREYAYVNGERLALIDTTSGSIYYYHNDHLATPKALTDELGAVVWQADYTPFGELTETVNIIEQPFRFPGQYYDEETGLYYNYFRDYDPGLGRYVQSDPIGLEGDINTYAYVEGNPLIHTDPKGLMSIPMVPGSGNTNGWRVNAEAERRRSIAFKAASHASNCNLKCSASCAGTFIVGTARDTYFEKAAITTLKREAASVARTWLLRGIPVVGQISTVYSSGVAISCAVNCWSQ